MVFPASSAASSPEPTRRSLANCRRVLARRLSSLTLVTTDAASPDTSSVVSSQLALALADANRYRNQWVYVYDGPHAGELRKVGDLALVAASGKLNVAPVFSSAIGDNTQVEIHRRLPPLEADGYPGLRECLNDALREVWVIDRLSVAAVTNQPTYDLGALFGGLADWLDPQAVVELYGPRVAAGLNLIPWSGFDARQDADSIVVDISPGLTSGQTATLEITRPGNTYMKVDGVWADNRDGFVRDTDESLFRPDVLADVALTYAYQALADNSEAAAQARWQALATRQRTQVNVWKMRQLPHPARRDSGSHSAVAPYTFPGDLKSWWTT
jgi:hypothetical protein